MDVAGHTDMQLGVTRVGRLVHSAAVSVVADSEVPPKRTTSQVARDSARVRQLYELSEGTANHAAFREALTRFSLMLDKDWQLSPVKINTFAPRRRYPRVETVASYGGSNTALAGFLVPTFYRVTVQRSDWRIQLRPSMTACILDGQTSLSKLWWSVIYSVESDGPSEGERWKQLEVLSRAVDEASLASIKLFADAYQAQMQRLVQFPLRQHDQPIAISIADTDNGDLDRLIEYVYEETGLSSLEGNAAARRGYDLIAEFLSSRGIPHRLEGLMLDPAVQNVIGLYSSKDLDRALWYAGFARRTDLRLLKRAVHRHRQKDQLDDLNLLSGARPFSAHLATLSADRFTAVQTAEKVA